MLSILQWSSPHRACISQGDKSSLTDLGVFTIVRNVFFPLPQWKIRFNHTLAESRWKLKKKNNSPKQHPNISKQELVVLQHEVSGFPAALASEQTLSQRSNHPVKKRVSGNFWSTPFHLSVPRLYDLGCCPVYTEVGWWAGWGRGGLSPFPPPLVVWLLFARLQSTGCSAPPPLPPSDPDPDTDFL